MAKRKSKRTTKKTTQYTRQRNRINAYQRKLRKQGYEINYYFPTERELRLQGIYGTELAKYTRELKQIKPTQLREWALPPTPKPEVPSMVDIIINTYYNTILNYNDQARQALTDWMHHLISDNGREAVARMIHDASEHGVQLHYGVNYDGKAITAHMSDMMTFLPDQGDLYKEQILQAFEEDLWLNV